MPMVRQTFVISTTTAHVKAILELPFHPALNHDFFRTEDDLLGDFSRGFGVPLIGSGVYAVLPWKSGLNMSALGRLDL